MDYIRIGQVIVSMKFITGESAVLVGDALVLGELHIGMESEIFSKGISTPSGTKDMEKRILKIIKSTKAKKLIILGDVKHNYLKISKQEAREIPSFFEELCKKAEVHVTLGNHDGLLQQILPPQVIVHPTEGLLYKDSFFLHGNAWPSKEVIKAKTLFMAHIHPAVGFRDRLGFRNVEFCWIRGKATKKVEERYGSSELEEIIIVPPFNRKIGGMPVNSEFKEKDISPITRNGLVNVEKSEVYLLDGTHIGTVKSLRK